MIGGTDPIFYYKFTLSENGDIAGAVDWETESGSPRLVGTGDDVFEAGAGNDRITTGSGSDRIGLSRGNGFDRITDFRNKLDKIDLIGIRFNQLTLNQQGRDVLIKLGNTNVLMIENIRQSAIDRTGFV